MLDIKDQMILENVQRRVQNFYQIILTTSIKTAPPIKDNRDNLRDLKDTIFLFKHILYIYIGLIVL